MNEAISKVNPQNKRTDLAVVEGNFGQNSIAKLKMDEVKELAEVFHASGQFPDVKSIAQACVKIMAGNELGFTPIVSMTGIHFFQGKIEFSSTLKAALIKDSGKYEYKITEHTNQACTAVFYQKIGNELKQIGVPVRYTIDDARNAGLLAKDTWKKYPTDLLFAAVIRQGTRRYCADVLRGTVADHDTGYTDDLPDTQPMQIASAPADVQYEADAPDTAETIVHEGEVVDTATGEVVDPNELDPFATTIEAETDDTPLFTGSESQLIDLREAVTSAYNATKGASRAAANKLLGTRTIGSMDAGELAQVLEGLESL